MLLLEQQQLGQGYHKYWVTVSEKYDTTNKEGGHEKPCMHTTYHASPIVLASHWLW